VTPVGLRCAHLQDPLGVAPDRVRFSWLSEGNGSQHSYQIQVFQNGPASPPSASPVWDSGRVLSGDSCDVAYAGADLAAGSRYRWRVRVWSSGASGAADEAAPEWSPAAFFETELSPASWGAAASWIGLGAIRENFAPPTGDEPADQVANALRPAPYLRRLFHVPGPVAFARLHVTALGLYEARLNGSRVGDAFLTPGWTDYSQRVLYQTYDVTSLLAEGPNVLGAVLADGWYSGFVGFDAKRAGAHYGTAPELLAQLVITFTDGSVAVVGTDDSWEGRFAAVRHADLLMGEKHDLRLEPAGWDAPGLPGTEPESGGADGWRAVRCRDAGGPGEATLAADPGPPVRVTESVPPVRVWRDEAGRLLADFGQNLTGWVRLRGPGGPAGTVITVRHGEALDSDGSLYTVNLRTARATDEYVLAGRGPVVLEPRFTQHGFRYAEITGYPGSPAADDIVARVAHSDIPVAAAFESAQPWLGRLLDVIDWGQRGNFISVPTDCPQRDERLGWLGDAQIFARTACYNRDVAAFFGKWLDDVADAQFPSGAYPDIAPRLHLRWGGSPAWADAGVIVPWTVWKMYGDLGVLSRHYDAMARWMAFVGEGNPDYLRTSDLGHSYNDWLAPGRDDTPRELLATAYWAYDAALMAEIAAVAGRPDEAASYRELLAKIRSAFAAAFVGADGQVASGTQTAYVLALHMDLVPDSLRAAAAARLVDAIRAADWHLTTGFVGVGYLLPVLSSCGYSSVAYRLLSQRTFPSWRYMIDHGATTIWERWDGWSAEHGFQSPKMNSLNHYSLGAVGEWVYRYLLGIDQQPGTAGFGELLMRPHVDAGGSLDWARGSYRSVRGVIRAGWRVSGDSFSYLVELPANVAAVVCVPAGDGTGEAVYRVGPGTHKFTGTMRSA